MCRLTDVCKEITDLAPFEKGWNHLLKDNKLIQYLVLAVPFLEDIIESIINTLLFKFQNKKRFLTDSEDSLLEILKLPDPVVIQEELESQAGQETVNSRNRFTKSLLEQVKWNFILEVRINIMKYKFRALSYLRKVYTIFELNFLSPYRNFFKEHHNDESITFCDPYKIIWFALSATHSDNLKGELMMELDHYDANTSFGMLESEHFMAVNNHIRKKDHNSSESALSQNSQVEIVREDSIASNRDSLEDHTGISEMESRSIESQDSIVKEGLRVKLTPQLEILQDWLFSEEVPFFNKNEYVKQFIAKNEELEMFFRIVLSPLKYPLDPKAKKKYGKLTQHLHPDFKHSRPIDRDWSYKPEKHNVYYLRARRMMIIFLFKPNINCLMSVNKNFVDVFYSVLDEEVWKYPKSRANMDWVFKLMQYFLLIDIAGSMKNIIKYHIPYYLMANIEIFSARLTLTCLLAPGDMLFKIPGNY
jgi:hypothetical protein